jgi:flagellar biosynthetic protein FliQ
VSQVSTTEVTEDAEKDWPLCPRCRPWWRCLWGLSVSDAVVVGIIRQALEVAVIVAVPMLAAGLIAGILVSVFQTVTSIQDHVLAFIPRAAAIFAVFALTFPWMLRVLTGFSRQLIMRLPELVR